MELKYIELKTGWNDNGPAWIGFVKESRSGKMVYFNDHAFQRHSGEYSNYIDVETREKYWISGVKKNGEDRHWAGGGIITIDEKAVDLYLSITGMKELPKSRYPGQQSMRSFERRAQAEGEEPFQRIQESYRSYAPGTAAAWY